jgi:hypothetical protein
MTGVGTWANAGKAASRWRNVALLLCLLSSSPAATPSNSRKPQHPYDEESSGDDDVSSNELVPALEGSEEAAEGFGRGGVKVEEGEEDVLRGREREETTVSTFVGRRGEGEEGWRGEEKKEEEIKKKRTVKSAAARHPRYAFTTLSNPLSFPFISLFTVGNNTLPKIANRKKHDPSCRVAIVAAGWRGVGMGGARARGKREVK